MSVVQVDLSDIFEEAFEQAVGEIKTGYDIRTVRRSFNLLTMEWANRGLNLWTIEEGSVPLVAGVQTYDMPADTIDLIEHYVRDANNLDRTLVRTTVSNWAKQSVKSQEGLPNQIFIRRLADKTEVKLWPIPNSSNYTLQFWRLVGMDGLDAGIGAGTFAPVPPRFVPALVAGLAYRIAVKKSSIDPNIAQRVQPLKDAYEEQFTMAAGEDRDRASVYLIPAAGNYR